jgi:hypothetical protein
MQQAIVDELRVVATSKKAQLTIVSLSKPLRQVSSQKTATACNCYAHHAGTPTSRSACGKMVIEFPELEAL